jgi:hypothetical protein
MDIKFVIEPDLDADDYLEQFTAEVTMEDGTTFTVSATENEVSYDQFRADIFEDLFRSLAEATGITVNLDEEDYASFDLEEVDALLEDYLADPDINGC